MFKLKDEIIKERDLHKIRIAFLFRVQVLEEVTCILKKLKFKKAFVIYNVWDNSFFLSF